LCGDLATGSAAWRAGVNLISKLGLPYRFPKRYMPG
jgi:hypothetical protein